MKTTKINTLSIGDRFYTYKNGVRLFEYLGFCPIENIPCALSSKGEICYFSPNKSIYLPNNEKR